MTVPIDRIFLDLDGVLADWIGGVCRLYGIDRSLAENTTGPYQDISDVLGVSTNALWRAVDEAGSRFWAELDRYPWARPLFEYCEAIAPTTILTSPSWHPTSLSGKLEWLNRHLRWRGEKAFRQYLIGPDKVACARPGALLIDDRDSQCEAFRAAGGSAILFPQPWNKMRDRKDRAGHVYDELGSMAKNGS